MCVGQEAMVLELKRSLARVKAAGLELDAASDLMLDIQPGDRVMVHAGTIIAKVEESSQTLDDLLEEK